MLKDRFDTLTLIALGLVLVALAVLLGSADLGQARQKGAMDKRMERELAYQAHLGLLERYYGPVEELRNAGELQAGLLKLKEVERDLPGEAHGLLLKGELLYLLGSPDQAIPNLAEAVRVNGDYVDDKSPLNRRALIDEVVRQSMPQLRDRLRTQPDNRVLATTMKQAYYLQSRLAGGCE